MGKAVSRDALLNFYQVHQPDLAHSRAMPLLKSVIVPHFSGLKSTLGCY